MTTFPKQGQWVRWLTPEFGREGEVIEARWPSLVIRWLGVDQPQVFPYGYMYFDDEHPSAVMEYIQRPAKLPENRQPSKSAAMSVRDAAAALELTPKQVRMKLRSGKLKGLQKEGRWVAVYL